MCGPRNTRTGEQGQIPVHLLLWLTDDMKRSFTGSRRHCGPQDQVVFQSTLINDHDINDFPVENLELDLDSSLAVENSDLRREECLSKLDLCTALFST